AAPVVEASAPAGRRPVAAAAAVTDSPATLAEEVRLLREAQDAVASSPGRTLELGEEHRRRFPRGTLTQEREVLVIDALVRLGRGEAAVRRADGFSRRFPGSGHLARVQDLVAEVSTQP
ncbi:MAG: hypothetical protein L0206_13240, partial [Actinobacteria bacterium]|nr:hypothetical protein [Actinomycetota bacterium]